MKNRNQPWGTYSHFYLKISQLFYYFVVVLGQQILKKRTIAERVWIVRKNTGPDLSNRLDPDQSILEFQIRSKPPDLLQTSFEPLCRLSEMFLLLLLYILLISYYYNILI